MNPQLYLSLQDAGLSVKEAKVYLAMLELGESSIIPIARRAGIKRTTVYNYLEDFIRLGLISISTRNNRRYYIANSPNRLRVLLRDRLEKIETVLPNLFSLYNTDEAKPAVQMYEGIEGIKTVFELSLEALSKKVDVIPVVNSGYNLVGADYIAHYIERAFKAGISFRSLRLEDDQSKGRFNDPRINEPKTSEQRQIKIAPAWFSPTSYIHIYDDKVATFSQTGETPYAVILSSTSFTQTMRLFYESIWNQSQPLNQWKKG